MNKLTLEKDGTDVVIALENSDEIGAFQIGIIYPNLTVGVPVLSSEYADFEFFSRNHPDKGKLLMLAFDFDIPLSVIGRDTKRELVRVPYEKSIRWGVVAFVSDFTRVFDYEGDKLPLELGSALLLWA